MDGQPIGDPDPLAPEDEYKPTFYIGHHDSKRTEVQPSLLQQAQDCNVSLPSIPEFGSCSSFLKYDMLTIPITTPYFNLRVLSALIECCSADLSSDESTESTPIISPLSAPDTNLGPGETVSQLLGVVAPWIDLSSPDAVVYSVSCQVLQMEVAYAAFCGVGNLILPGPKLHYGKKYGEGVSQYAHAIREAMELASFIQFSITLPIMDNPHDAMDETNGSLSSQARPDFGGGADDSESIFQKERKSFESQPCKLLDFRPRRKIPVSSKHDYFGTWDAWNIIRTVCNYSSRLFVGKRLNIAHKLVEADIHFDPFLSLFLM